jgi:hypothetical protein
MLSNIVGLKLDKVGDVVLVWRVTILIIFMKIKSHEKSLGCNLFSDVLYRNLDMMLNGQGADRHPFGGALYLDLDTMLSK